MYLPCMKLTLNIDDELLDRVRETTGAKTKTEAIHIALNEMDRRHKLISMLAHVLQRLEIRMGRSRPGRRGFCREGRRGRAQESCKV
jgi:Bacterial antitoxin of type II TA system, VapB